MKSALRLFVMSAALSISVGCYMRDSTSKALERAVIQGDTNLLATFLSSGGDINIHVRGYETHPQSWETPLHIAVDAAQQDTIAFLLMHGANPNATNWRGYTPLLRAVGVDAPEQTRVQIIRRLIAAGADVNAETHNGSRPLDSAVHFGSSNVVLLLQQSGAILGNTNSDSGR